MIGHNFLGVQLRLKLSDGYSFDKFEHPRSSGPIDYFKRLISFTAVSLVHYVFSYTAASFFIGILHKPDWHVLFDPIFESSKRAANVLLLASTTCETINDIRGGHCWKTVFG